jgi:4-amino-4-deoxy-L-arabinose transferase-like glycosyltransferase
MTKRKWIPVICIFLFSLLIRTFMLDKIPTGVSDDEMLYFTSSRSFFYSSLHMLERLPFFSNLNFRNHIALPNGQTPYMLLAPYYGLFPYSMFMARFPYAFMGSLFVVIIFLFSKKLFGYRVGIIVALLTAINPWSVFFSRTAYESPVAMYFAYLMLLLLLYAESWYIVFLFGFYILSFYSYIGTKLILPFFSAFSIFYVWLKHNKRWTQYYLLLLLGIITSFSLYLIYLPNNIDNRRMNELLSPATTKIVNSVNFYRKQAIQTPLASVFINKYLETGSIFMQQYVNAFSPEFLFIKGEGSSRYSLWFHGLFYLIDIVFLLIGIYVIFRKHKKEGLLLLCLTLIAPLPSAIHYSDTQYVLRSSFLYPILLVYIGYGIFWTTQAFNKRYISTGIIIIYLISFLNFAYIYIMRNPISNYDSFGVSGRVLSYYILFAEKYKYNIQVLSHGANVNLAKQYLFFGKKYNITNYAKIAGLFQNPSISMNYVRFVDCKDAQLGVNTITVIPFNLSCIDQKLPITYTSITDISNNQPIYQIYNDKICSKYNLLPYLYNIQLQDFNIENLSEKRFCEKFFTRDAGFPTTTSNALLN